MCTVSSCCQIDDRYKEYATQHFQRQSLAVANNITADDWLTVQLTVCTCHYVLCLQPFSRCHSFCATNLSTSKAATESQCHITMPEAAGVPLLYRPIYKFQCYLEAASSWVNVFDVPHQQRTIVFHYTAITCSWSVYTGSVGRYPIPNAGNPGIGLSLTTTATMHTGFKLRWHYWVIQTHCTSCLDLWSVGWVTAFQPKCCGLNLNTQTCRSSVQHD